MITALHSSATYIYPVFHFLIIMVLEGKMLIRSINGYDNPVHDSMNHADEKELTWLEFKSPGQYSMHTGLRYTVEVDESIFEHVPMPNTTNKGFDLFARVWL